MQKQEGEELNDEYQAEQITSWKNILKLPLKGIMSSASQINPDIANSNILLFQYHSSISLLHKQEEFRGLQYSNEWCICTERKVTSCIIASLSYDLRTNNILSSDVFEIFHLLLGYSIFIAKLPSNNVKPQ